jgi:23S rRNA (guanosine2251-2'-O)-methyltransferase
MGSTYQLFGRNVFEEALSQKVLIKEVFAENEAASRWADTLVKKYGLRMTIKPHLPSALRSQSHQGIAFTCAHDFYLSAKSVSFTKMKRIVLCNHLEDVQNLGALVRSAAAFGVDLLVHEERRSAELTAAAVKASAGQAFRLKFLKVSSLGSCLSDLKREGFETAALSAGSSQSIYRWNPAPKWAVVVGSEGAGVQSSVLKSVEQILEIPMSQGVESLNVAQAGSILLSWAFSGQDSR